MNVKIKGRRYNTASAHLIGENADRETLYQKSTSEFFLHFADKNKILPLTHDDAKDWAKKYLDAAAYSALFPTLSAADGRKVTLSISVDAATNQRLRLASVARGVTMSALVCDLAKALPDG